MKKLHSTFLLRQIRNEINIKRIIKILQIPQKYSEGYLRFLCPHCHEFNTATKNDTNLARCFRCKKNYNPIDMVMKVNNVNFLDAICFLKHLLKGKVKR